MSTEGAKRESGERKTPSELRKAARKTSFWTISIAAHGVVLALLPLIIFSQRIFTSEDRTIVTLRSPTAEKLSLSDPPAPQATIDRTPLPEEAPRITMDEAAPAISFPNAIESDHYESADGEDYAALKGDSSESMGRIPGTDGGYRGRAAGKGPGVDVAIGVGGGSGGSSRYGGAFGGRRNTVAAAPNPRVPEASERASSEPGIQSAQRLATAEDLRPKPPVLLARPNGPKQEPLPLESLRVAALLGATRGRILVDCTFKNPFPTQLEGTFQIALPDGASPCYLGMFQGTGAGQIANPEDLLPPPLDPNVLLASAIDLPSRWDTKTTPVEWGVLRPARVVEEKQGKQVYERVTRRRIDPALMEWSGGNRFSTRIFPIVPNGRKRVFFVFDQAPKDVGGKTTLALPVPAPLPAAARVEAACDARVYESAGLLKDDGEEKLAGTAPFLRTALSPRADSKGAFVLEATPKPGSVRGGYAAAQGIPGGQVHARLFPRVSAAKERRTCKAVFLLDTSLSQRTKLAPSCGRLLSSILEKDQSIDEFAVVAFDVAARHLTDGFRRNICRERAAIAKTVSDIWLEGATNLDAALDVLDVMVDKDVHPTFFLLSDAQLTWGVDEPRELERAHARLFSERWIAYQIGDAPVNRPLVDRLTRSGGRLVTIASAQEVEGAALAHTATPTLLRSVKVEGVPASDMVVAGSPRTLFQDQVLEVAFRVPAWKDPAQATIVVETDAGTQRFPLAESVADEGLACRAWAELTSNALLDLGDEAADKVALALSQRFALANRVASFLILETDAEYAVHKIQGEELNLESLAAAVASREFAVPAGGPDCSSVDARGRAFLASIREKRLPAWSPSFVPDRSKVELSRPRWNDRIDMVAVYKEAARRHTCGRDEEAVRILSSIIEESPRDAVALRLGGYALLSWGQHAEAASLFARTRRLRPFEPQAWLCEALALEARGMTAEAATRYELVLAGHFDQRHEQFAKAGARRLYARLLSRLGTEEATRRANELGLASELSLPAQELVLFWNLDDTDVDLHVVEAAGPEVDYRYRSSPSGGRLHWDNTTGLGPEIYTHPKTQPVEAYVHYFGTQSVSGTVPAATLLVSFPRDASPFASCAVLADRTAKVVLWRAASW